MNNSYSRSVFDVKKYLYDIGIRTRDQDKSNVIKSHVSQKYIDNLAYKFKKDLATAIRQWENNFFNIDNYFFNTSGFFDFDNVSLSDNKLTLFSKDGNVLSKKAADEIFEQLEFFINNSLASSNLTQTIKARKKSLLKPASSPKIDLTTQSPFEKLDDYLNYYKSRVELAVEEAKISAKYNAAKFSNAAKGFPKKAADAVKKFPKKAAGAGKAAAGAVGEFFYDIGQDASSLARSAIRNIKDLGSYFGGGNPNPNPNPDPNQNHNPNQSPRNPLDPDEKKKILKAYDLLQMAKGQLAKEIKQNVSNPDFMKALDFISDINLGSTSAKSMHDKYMRMAKINRMLADDAPFGSYTNTKFLREAEGYENAAKIYEKKQPEKAEAGLLGKFNPASYAVAGIYKAVSAILNFVKHISENTDKANDRVLAEGKNAVVNGATFAKSSIIDAFSKNSGYDFNKGIAGFANTIASIDRLGGQARRLFYANLATSGNSDMIRVVKEATIGGANPERLFSQLMTIAIQNVRGGRIITKSGGVDEATALNQVAANFSGAGIDPEAVKSIYYEFSNRIASSETMLKRWDELVGKGDLYGAMQLLYNSPVSSIGRPEDKRNIAFANARKDYKTAAENGINAAYNENGVLNFIANTLDQLKMFLMRVLAPEQYKQELRDNNTEFIKTWNDDYLAAGKRLKWQYNFLAGKEAAKIGTDEGDVTTETISKFLETYKYSISKKQPPEKAIESATRTIRMLENIDMGDVSMEQLAVMQQIDALEKQRKSIEDNIGSNNPLTPLEMMPVSATAGEARQNAFNIYKRSVFSSQTEANRRNAEIALFDALAADNNFMGLPKSQQETVFSELKKSLNVSGDKTNPVWSSEYDGLFFSGKYDYSSVYSPVGDGVKIASPYSGLSDRIKENIIGALNSINIDMPSDTLSSILDYLEKINNTIKIDNNVGFSKTSGGKIEIMLHTDGMSGDVSSIVGNPQDFIVTTVKD